MKAHNNDFDTNYIRYYQRVPLFCWFDHFLYPRAEICQFFCWFFGKFKTSKRLSEINWPFGGVVFTIGFETSRGVVMGSEIISDVAVTATGWISKSICGVIWKKN